MAQSYQAIAATIAAGTRSAEGVGGAFSKDLSAYFSAGFTQSASVALVNFPDLEPGNGGPGNPGTNLPGKKAKAYHDCNYYTWNLPKGATGPQPYQINAVCNRKPQAGVSKTVDDWLTPAPYYVTNCSGAKLTPVPPFGALTHGWYETRQTMANPVKNCPPNNQQCEEIFQQGTVTMNATTIATGSCRQETWRDGTQIVTTWGWTAVGVCCSYSHDGVSDYE